jgi:hypothetical protein
MEEDPQSAINHFGVVVLAGVELTGAGYHFVYGH